jgi:hypothetical protein
MLLLRVLWEKTLAGAGGTSPLPLHSTPREGTIESIPRRIDANIRVLSFLARKDVAGGIASMRKSRH